MDVEGLYKLARITCIRANLHRNSPNREFEFEDWVQEAVLGVITNRCPPTWAVGGPQRRRSW